MNGNPYANGSVIFTQSGYYAREFVRHTDGGMVGVNVEFRFLSDLYLLQDIKFLLWGSALPRQGCIPLLYGKQMCNNQMV